VNGWLTQGVRIAQLAHSGLDNRLNRWRLAWKCGLVLYLVALALTLNVSRLSDPSVSQSQGLPSPSYTFRESTSFLPQKPTPTDQPTRPVVRSAGSAGSADTVLAALQIKVFLPALLTHTIPLFDSSQSFSYEGINFQDGSSRVLIEITPPSKKVNGGKPIRISFLPGDQCEFGDKHACVFSYRSSAQANIIFLTIHSGVGGEGQKLRHAIEGTGINQAGLNLRRVLENLEALEGAAVSLHQSELSVSGLQVHALSRIPPKKIHPYFNLPVEQALDYAASLDETLLPAVLAAQPLIVLETCGWKMPGEPWAKDVTDTTGSIYLGIIAPASTP
jgi:hypothetical protein